MKHVDVKKERSRVELFVLKLEESYRELVEFDNELAAMAMELERLEALRQSTLGAS